MTIHWLEEVDSTQRYLTDALVSGELTPPCVVVADRQYAGRGSRGNAWSGMEGNLFFSFALERTKLPDDLKLESSSIYFAFLMKQVLQNYGSEIWLKWPNDFYVKTEKVGGVITTIRHNTLICGMGLNLKKAPKGFGVIDIVIERKMLMNDYIERLKTSPEWKQIFRLYAIEFGKSRSFVSHNKNKTFSLKDSTLLEDGSILCNGKRIYSLR